jgi:Holliday junction DNA helicase RuvA
MIYTLTGELALKKENFIVIDASGVGYKVFISSSLQGGLPATGSRLKVFIYTHIRENAFELYGFLEEKDLDFFELLVSVSGIGPKSAMGILSVGSIDRLSTAIANGETELLQKSSGVGRKTSERIILELKDKVKSFGGKETVKMMESDNDIYEAMASLGYTVKQIKDVIGEIDPNLKNVSDRLRDALKKIKKH